MQIDKLTKKEKLEGERAIQQFMKDTGGTRSLAEKMLEINLERDPLFLADYELVKLDF